MKTAISLPDELFASAEALAERLGVSRSALFATAVAEFLAKHQARKVTDRLNALYAEEPSTVDPRLARAQKRTAARSEW
jgi:metal-responsive CopG/Arc/MetJ family transcriptional regulator